MKFSKQREIILNEVMNSHLHPTADSIYTSLKKDNSGLCENLITFPLLAASSNAGALR